jgi:hypothetical protein
VNDLSEIDGLLFTFRLAQRLVNDHLQVSLVAQTALGCLYAGLRNIIGIEANGGGWQSRALGDGTNANSSLDSCLFKVFEQGVFVRLPPSGFFRLIREGLVLQFFQHSHSSSETRSSGEIFPWLAKL